jgi:hypothetical protein
MGGRLLMPWSVEVLDKGLPWLAPQHWQGVKGKVAIDNVGCRRPGSSLEGCAEETSDQRRIRLADADETLIEVGRTNHDAFDSESLCAKFICQVEGVPIQATG